MAKFLRLGLGLGVIVALIQFSGNGSAAALLDNLLTVHVSHWVSLAILSLVAMVALSAAFRTSIKVIDVLLPVRHAFSYTIMNSFFNTVLPLKGGVWVRGYYLKQQFGVSWRKYLFVLFSSQLAQTAILISIALALISLANIPLTLTIDLSQMVAITIIIGVAAGLAILLLSENARTGARLWVAKPECIGVYLIFAAIFHTLTALRLWFALNIAGASLSVTELVLLYSVLAAGLGWAITPGNIGVKEAAIVLISGLLGISTEAALAASIIDRIASLLVIIGVGGPISYQFTKASESRL